MAMVMNVLTPGLLPRTLRHTASTPMGTLGTGQESAILFETARTELHLMFQNRSLMLLLQTSQEQRIHKWDWVTTTILLGVKGQHKSKKEKFRLVAAALAAAAQHVLANKEPVIVTANGVPKYEITVREL